MSRYHSRSSCRAADFFNLSFAMEFVKSQRGNDLGVHDGFIYKKEMVRGEKIYWVCCKYDSERCTGRCVTNDKGENIVSTQQHNHTVDPAEAEKRKRLGKLKELAVATQDLPCQIIAEVVSQASRSVAANLPSSALLSRTINN